MNKLIALAPVALIMGIAGNAQAATQADVKLLGTITETTCEVVANNGVATLNVGSFRSTEFTAASKQVGSEPLKVTLANCAEDEAGALQVSGVVGADNSVFVSDTTQTAGFMLTEADGTTQVTNGTSVPVTADKDGALSYTFNAGMAVLDADVVEAGQYNAPIKISYIAN